MFWKGNSVVNLLLASAHLPTIFITILEAVYKEMSLAPGPLANGLTQREMGGQEGRALGAVVRGGPPCHFTVGRLPHSSKATAPSPSCPLWILVLHRLCAQGPQDIQRKVWHG